MRPMGRFCPHRGAPSMNSPNWMMAGSRIGTMVPICPPRGALVNLFAHVQKLPPSWGTLVELNMARRHLNQEQRRGLIQAELKDRPQVSDRQIAKSLGVSNPTVSAVRKEMEEKGDVLKFNTSIDSLGRQQPRQVAKPAPEPARHVSLFSAAAREHVRHARATL